MDTIANGAGEPDNARVAAFGVLAVRQLGLSCTRSGCPAAMRCRPVKGSLSHSHAYWSTGSPRASENGDNKPMTLVLVLTPYVRRRLGTVSTSAQKAIHALVSKYFQIPFYRNITPASDQCIKSCRNSVHRNPPVSFIGWIIERVAID